MTPHEQKVIAAFRERFGELENIESFLLKALREQETETKRSVIKIMKSIVDAPRGEVHNRIVRVLEAITDTK